MTGKAGGAAQGPDSGHNVAQDIVAQVETGPRHADSAIWRAVIVVLCLMWSGFQLYIADVPFDSWLARSIHLAFALALVFLAYPGFKHNSPSRLMRSLGHAIPSRGGERHGFVLLYDMLFGSLLIAFAVWTFTSMDQLLADLQMMEGETWSFIPWVASLAAVLEGARRLIAIANRFVPVVPTGRVERLVCGNDEVRSNRTYIPVYDILLGLFGALSSLYIVFDYEGIVTRQGLPLFFDVWVGVTCTVLLLEAARRALGPALAILATIFLVYLFAGPYLPEVIRHRGMPLDYAVNDIFLSTSGIFGVPLEVSTSIIFLFVLFGALLEKAGAGQFFIDVAFAAFGRFRGGAAKAAIVASGMTGLYSGSSVANTVTTGTFTIPLMKKVGLPGYKAGAVEVAASTNGQLMPPVMGAAAFIMAEIIGVPYLDVVRAAFIPAIISYLALFYVVHLEALKLGIRALDKHELPRFFGVLLRGLHYLIPIAVLFFFLLYMRRSPILSALYAVEALAVIMVLQRPIIAFLTGGMAQKGGTEAIDRHGIYRRAIVQGVVDIWDGLIAGARNMITIAIATASAGIIVGVVQASGLVGRFVTLIETISFGNIYLVLVLTAIMSMILGMGLPTTANYILMASLTAPVIIHLGGDAGYLFPLLGVHLFVFYFGILADDTPPVGLAAYAAAAIAKSDPIRTGVQGFTYDMRTAILPFVFIFNTELLMIAGQDASGHAIWIHDIPKLIFVFVAAVAAMFSFAAGVQGWFAAKLNVFGRLFMLAICLVLFLPRIVHDPTGIPREIVQVGAMAVLVGFYLWQKFGSPGKSVGSGGN